MKIIFMLLYFKTPKTIASIFCLLFLTATFAQAENIVWTDKKNAIDANSSLAQIIGDDGQNVFVLYRVGYKDIIYSYSLSNLSLVKSSDNIASKIDRKSQYINNITLHRNYISVITSAFSKSSVQIYSHIYDKRSLALKSSRVLSEYNRLEYDNISVDVVNELSPKTFARNKTNENTLVLSFANNRVADTTNKSYDINLYNSRFESINSANIMFDDPSLSIKKIILGDNNKVFILARNFHLYHNPSNSGRQGKDHEFHVFTFDFSTEKLKELELELSNSDSEIGSTEISINGNNELLISGILNDPNGEGQDGVFFLKWNANVDQKTESFYLFDQNKIENTMWRSHHSMERLGQRNVTNGSPKKVMDFKEPEIFNRKNGNTTVILQQKYRANAATIPTIYFNALLVAEFNTSGELEWYHFIPQFKVVVSSDKLPEKSYFAREIGDDFLIYLNVYEYKEGKLINNNTKETSTVVTIGSEGRIEKEELLFENDSRIYSLMSFHENLFKCSSDQKMTFILSSPSKMFIGKWLH